MKIHLIGYGTLLFLTGLMAGVIFFDDDKQQRPLTVSSQPDYPAADRPPEYTPPVRQPEANVDYQSLIRDLREEKAARLQLEARLTELSKQLASLETQQGMADMQASTSYPTDSQAHSSGASPPPRADSTTWIDEQVLLQAGLSLDSAMTVKQEFEKLEMDKLYLRDRATREGWIGTARYVEELEKLSQTEQSIRSQIGEENYGAYLYATGQSNQVYVEAVLESSPAQQAGLQAGDVLIQYGDYRIYTWSDVRAATAAGQAGEQVQLTLNRDGQLIQTYVNRGPLGIRMGVRTEQP